MLTIVAVHPEVYEGTAYKVVHCSGALESLERALLGVEARKREKMKFALALQIERLANGQSMSNENFPEEGDLPFSQLTGRRAKFRALKRLPVRGYCWLSDKHQNTWFLSHYIKKDFNKLHDSDIQRVHHNWRALEE